MNLAIELAHIDKIHLRKRAGSRSLKRALLSVFRKRIEPETISAADDISLAIEKGSGLGIVGANGAGKSTLLRLVAGITPPTRGKIHTEGRILPLLELGAGFHPDLSGMENIYLQGVMLGLDRERVRKLAPSIIEFAELEPHIHRPVRHYSSGMYLRLGFSISIHMTPDILLVDEAFSVGDLHFQQKCLDKMREFHQQGGTFLLVSHDIDTIEQVCDEAIWIDQGRIVARGAPTTVSHAYKKAMFQKIYPEPAPFLRVAQAASPQGGRFGNGFLCVDYLDFLDKSGNTCHCFTKGDAMEIRAAYRVSHPERLARQSEGAMPDLHCMFFIQSALGHGAACVWDQGTAPPIPICPQGGAVSVRVPRLDLAPGRYGLAAVFYSGCKDDLNTVYDLHARVYSFSVASPEPESEVAALSLPCSWEKRQDPDKRK